MIRFGAVFTEVHPKVKNKVSLTPRKQQGKPGWETTSVYAMNPGAAKSEPAGDMLGIARQKSNSPVDVKFFQGPGGFSTIVENKDLVYIALPGAEVEFPEDTEVKVANATSDEPKAHDAKSSVTSNLSQNVTDQGMILGAGLATRLEPVSGETTGLPKPSIPLVGDDSVLSAQAKYQRGIGITHLKVNTLFKPERIKEQLAKVDGVDIAYVDELVASGPAGGLFKALKAGMIDKTKPILITQGDAVHNLDLTQLMKAHKEHGALVTIGVQPVPQSDISKVGIVVTDHSGDDSHSGYVQDFQEKPSLAEAKGDLGSIGFYLIDPKAYPLFLEIGEKYFAKGPEYDYAKDFFPDLLAMGKHNKLNGVKAYAGSFLNTLNKLRKQAASEQAPKNPLKLFRTYARMR